MYGFKFALFHWSLWYLRNKNPKLKSNYSFGHGLKEPVESIIYIHSFTQFVAFVQFTEQIPGMQRGFILYLPFGYGSGGPRNSMIMMMEFIGILKSYVYVYIYVCIYVCIYIYVCMYICMYVYMYVCIYVCNLWVHSGPPCYEPSHWRELLPWDPRSCHCGKRS